MYRCLVPVLTTFVLAGCATAVVPGADDPMLFGGAEAASAKAESKEGLVCHWSTSLQVYWVLSAPRSSAHFNAALHPRDVEAATFYADNDGDGFGDPAGATARCPSAGFVADASDCDDTEPLAYGGAEEVCDGVDNNCDGSLDEGCQSDDLSVCSGLVGADLGNVPTWDGRCLAMGGAEYGGHCYYVAYGAYLWPDARATCEAAGGYLATVSDAGENEFLSMFNTRAYIGLCDDDSEGTFTWVTHEPVTYTLWYGVEPSNTDRGDVDGEDVVEMGGSYYRQTWNDIWEDYNPWAEGFFCEFG